jgi:hypothetical protein
VGVAAQLLADRGELAAADEFFRSRPFFDAEGVTHTLRIESADRVASVPLVVREIEDAERADATSPYGYPGASVSGAGPAPAPSEVDWSASGLVSIFARERLSGEPWLAGPTERSRVLIHDPSRPRRLRPRLAEQIRAGERDGWRVEAIPGPESAPDDRDRFAEAYEQTMHRAGAAERYFFPRAYFDAVLSFERSWLLAARRAGDFGAAAIAAVSDGTLHYYLGGTAQHALDSSPFKNVVATMLDLADELELPLNLGGGVEPGDGLEAFKRGFANGDLPFFTQEVVCEPDEYERLLGGRQGAGFFPAYRATSA